MRASHAALPRQGQILLALLTIFWGLNWPVMKIALSEIPLWTFRSLSVGGGALGLLAIAGLNGARLKVPAGQWGRLLGIAFFNITAWNVLVVYGLSHLPSGRAAILAYTMPLWGTMLSAWLLHERLTGRRALGLALGIAGMLLLMGKELLALRAVPMGTVFMLGAAIAWAVGTVLMKRFPVEMPTTSMVGWQLLLGGLPIVAGAVLFEPHAIGLVSGTVSWAASLSVIYNVFVSFIFCYWAWYKIVAMVPVSVSALSTLMIPVVGVMSGMLLLGERPHWQEFAALGLVIAALATVLLPSRSGVLRKQPTSG